MSLKIKKFLIFIAAAAIYLTGQYFRGVWLGHFLPGLCLYKESPAGAYCNWPYFATLGLPLIAAGEIFAIVGVIMLFANKAGMRMWARFSIWYVPLAVIIAAYFVPSSPLGLLNGGAFTGDRVNTVWLLGYFYILWAFAIVAGTRYSAWRASRQNLKTQP